jgi:hypothetical protein
VEISQYAQVWDKLVAQFLQRAEINQFAQELGAVIHDQLVQKTEGVLTEQTVQPQIENPIRLIGLVGLNTSLDMSQRVLTGGCRIALDDRQRIVNT